MLFRSTDGGEEPGLLVVHLETVDIRVDVQDTAARDDHADAVDRKSLGDVELGEVIAADDDPGVPHDELPRGAWEEKAQERQLFAVGERDDGLEAFPHRRQLVHVLDALQDRGADRFFPRGRVPTVNPEEYIAF